MSSGYSQKEMAANLAAELKEKQQERVELGVITDAKNDLERERNANKAILQEAIADKGYVISVPDTEVVLYEDDGYQLLYCNNIDYPGKVTFLMAMKTAARKISGRTPITQQGYVAVPMARDQFNLILASHTKHNRIIQAKENRIIELETEIAPLRYINHLINKHKLDTKE